MKIVKLLCLTALAALASDSSDAVALVQKTFDAMLAHDGAALDQIFLKDARIVAVREDGTATTTLASDFSARIGSSKNQLLERMWSPQVRVEGRIASVWAPYDFHRDGKFTHCGIDHADLAKTADGWKIAALVYTVQINGCAPSPLGPPKP